MDEEIEYSKEMLLKDLKYKLDEIQILQNGVSWIMENYEKGVLPE